jgi:thymidylate synthase ThyX
MDADFKRVFYVRYADDFLIGIIGSKQDAENIRDKVGKYLSENLHLELSDEKTLITNAKNSKARFLGYDIFVCKDQTPRKDKRGFTVRTKTNIIMSINLRELMHVSNLRLCTRAQLEIRQLFQAIKKEVEAQDERLASLLVPSCEVHNMCFEDKCCGKRPKLGEVLEGYERYKDLNK